MVNIYTPLKKSLIFDSARPAFCVFLLSALSLLLCSCASVPTSVCKFPLAETPQVGLINKNIFHTVAQGETLWRISKMYHVSTNQVMQANNLGKSTQIKVGQRLIIPVMSCLHPNIPLYYRRQWSYIVIHHSATDQGDAADFDKLHRRKGWECIGYDFVIDNGTRGKQDGQIEISPRWIRQEDGAHCHASDMNYKGIGICLVGNFSKENVSNRQMDSLVYLVNILRGRYKIPVSHIIGHGRVPGARTECPGRDFPWREFIRRIEHYS